MSNVPQKKSEVWEFLTDPSYKRQLEVALPKHIPADRMLRVCLTVIRTNRDLLRCSRESLMACVMGCGQLGLSPEPQLGQAYLVPFGNDATLIIGYRGYLSLARRTGEVQNVSARVVYENDLFELEHGLEEKLKHIPSEMDRGKPRGVYVVFRYKDGSTSYEYMTKAEIETIRKRSKQPNGKAWNENWEEMAKKTVIRRHIKLVPLSVELATAAHIDNLNPLNAADASENQLDFLKAAQLSEDAPIDVSPIDPPRAEELDVETIISAATPEVKHQALATLNLGGKEPGKDDPNMRNAYALKILEVQRAIPPQTQPQVVVLDEKVRKQILAFLKDESVASMYLDACETLKVEPLGNIAAHRDPDLKAIYDFCKQRVSA